MRGTDGNVNVAFFRPLSILFNRRVRSVFLKDEAKRFTLYFPRFRAESVRVLGLDFFTFRRSVCSWNLAWKVDEMTEIGSATMTTPLTHAIAPTALPRPVLGTISPYPIVQSVITAHHIE